MNGYIDFWKIIDKLNWKEISINSSTIRDYQEKVFKVFYDNEFSIENISDLREILKLYASVLRERVEQYSVENYGDRHIFPNNSEVIIISDDTFWDLCCHIVGLGKETFEYIFNNPSEIINYPNFRESFWYCFSDSDYTEYFNNRFNNEKYGITNNQEELIDEINDILSYCVDMALNRKYGDASDMQYLEKSKKDVERLIKKYIGDFSE